MQTVKRGSRTPALGSFVSLFSGLTQLDYYVFGTVFCLGLLRLAEPLWGDQSLFLVGAKAISNGAHLYRDFWDLKPPGIYGLYALAGRLFGFNEVGVHTLDLMWMMALAVALRLTLAPYFKRLWIAQLVPWLVVGSYFGIIDFRQQMQVESLVGLPLYMMLWCMPRAAHQPQKQWRWLTLSGVLAGIVVLFKLIYLPLISALWATYALHQFIQRRPAFILIVRDMVFPFAIGVLLPVIPVLLYWQSQGLLGEVFYTLIQYPPKLIAANPPRPITGLVKSMGWFVVSFLPLIVLAGFGIWRTIGKRRLLPIQLIVWLGLGLAMIMAQSQSWWSYHFMLLLVPIAILSGYGIDYLVEAVRSPDSGLSQYRRLVKLGLAGCMAFLLGSTGLTVAQIGQNMAQSAIPLTPAAQLAYQKQAAPLYQALDQSVQYVMQPGRQAGDIYVIGNPLVYLLTDRAQAVRLQGWISEMLLPEQWAELSHDLAQAKPPYIYVMREDVPRVAASFMTWLQGAYVVAQADDMGTWYERA